ncbi:hypothetical protein DB30_07115 [Enhygromyxa salina]|uniref:Uncharacterized protein n=1 Tax=Enhygromyxa salina TaxID=215803 RepID=A0A0C1Z940_9BACT|nr:hypothetical protein DB30_07115 [Enhygromyxa salina]
MPVDDTAARPSSSRGRRHDVEAETSMVSASSGYQAPWTSSS